MEQQELPKKFTIDKLVKNGGKKYLLCTLEDGSRFAVHQDSIKAFGAASLGGIFPAEWAISEKKNHIAYDPSSLESNDLYA